MKLMQALLLVGQVLGHAVRVEVEGLEPPGQADVVLEAAVGRTGQGVEINSR